MAKNITYIGAVREQSVDGFNEFEFVRKGISLSFGATGIWDGPEPDGSYISARETLLVMQAAQMNQVASLARL